MPDALREKFNYLQGKQESDGLIALLANMPVVSPKVRQGLFFRVGDEKAAVHSEPPVLTSRLFLGVVPGSPKEIEELYNRWYPKG